MAIIVTLLSREALGFWSWPFKVQAVAEQEPIIESTTYEYADSHAKRIAIIGMYQYCFLYCYGRRFSIWYLTTIFFLLD